MLKGQEILENEYVIFLNYLKAKFPVFHNSNFFFRDFQYGVKRFLEKKGIFLSYSDSEKLASDFALFLESKEIFTKVNSLGWRVNYSDFVTPAPGDPF